MGSRRSLYKAARGMGDAQALFRGSILLRGAGRVLGAILGGLLRALLSGGTRRW